MADNTLTKLIALIRTAENIEVRRAAVRVARALAVGKDNNLSRALLEALDNPDVELRQLAIEALGDARADEALPTLVRIVQTGGPEVESAATAIGHLGVRGTKALGKVMHEATPVLRRRIAAALALAGTESAVLATAESLLDDDTGVVEASAKSLASEVPQLTRSQKRALAEHLLEMVTPKKRGRAESKEARQNDKTHAAGAGSHQAGGPSATSDAAILRVLAALHAPEAEEVYWHRLESRHTSASRCAALNALATLDLPKSQAKLNMLFACASDPDFQVVAPALMLLNKVPAGRTNLKAWLALFEAPDVAAHMLAVQKLREIDASPVAKALLKQLRHPDKALRDAALAALSESKSGRDELFTALLEAPTPQEAWTLARAQQEPALKWSAAQRTKVFTQACKMHDADDRRADPFWFLLNAVDRDGTRKRLEERALAVRRKKNFALSVSYWRLLTRDPAVGSELRFELAATALKLSSHDTAASAREADPALEQFSRLLQDAAFDLFGRVCAAKWLDENDLFYLGFHFAEQPRLAREFGGQVLQLVVQRWPTSALGKNAKQKLKSEGLGKS